MQHCSRPAGRGATPLLSSGRRLDGRPLDAAALRELWQRLRARLAPEAVQA